MQNEFVDNEDRSPMRFDRSEIIDVVLFNNNYLRARHPSPRPMEELSGQTHIADNVWVGQLPTEFGDLRSRILKACEAPGEGCDLPSPSGYGYAFIRREAKEHSKKLFDPDDALYKCVELSRLVHPTSVGREVSARIYVDRDEIVRIVPHRCVFFQNPYAFVIEEDQDWLIPSDIGNIRTLVECYDKSNLPRRVRSAFWYHVSMMHQRYVDIRWLLAVTALESLIRIKDEQMPSSRKYAGSTRVFVDRLLAIGRSDNSLVVSEDDLRMIYKRRSDLAHGIEYITLDTETKRLYKTTEDLLRGILRKAITEPCFQAIFSSDAEVQERLPLR